MPSTIPQITTTDVPTTTLHITTTDAPTTTPQITSTDVTTTTPQIIAVTPNSPTAEATTTNPPIQIITSVPPTTTPRTTPERTTTIPTTTPEPPTPTPDIPTTTPPIITTPTTTDFPITERTTPITPVPTTTPELPTTTQYSPTTASHLVATTPDITTTPLITTTTTEATTPIPHVPTTTPELPTSVPLPTTTPEVTTTTTGGLTTTPEITTPIPIIPTTTPQPPTTTTPEITTPMQIIPTTTPEPPTTTTTQIITTSTDIPTTNAPIPTTAPKAPTSIPDSPTPSPQSANTAGPVLVVSPGDSTDVMTTGPGNSTTAAPVDLWMPIVAGVGASMVVLIIVIIIIACVTCCNRPVQLDEKYLTDEEEMLPLGQAKGTAGRAPREKHLDRPGRHSAARKKTDTKPKSAEKFRVKESYKSEAEDQISLVKGEEVEVINKPTDDWWFGRSQQKIGWFPTKHLQATGPETQIGADNPGFVDNEDSSLPAPPPSLQLMPLPNGTAGSDATLPVRAIGETTDNEQRRASLSNLSLPPPPPELLAHEDETTPPRSVDNISIGSVSTSASLRNMTFGNLDRSENTQTTPPNGRSDSPESLASTAQESVTSSRPPSRASYASRTPSTLGSPNIPWMGSVGRSHVRTHPHVKAVLRNGQPDTAEESRMHLIMNTNLPNREASMRSNRSGRSSEDRTGRDRKLSMALRLSEPESALDLDLPPPPPEFDSPKVSDPSPSRERYIAVYGYRATDDNQLNLEEDDVITVIERDPLGWARGVCIQTGQEGWFPESYVKKLGEDKKDSKATRTLGPPQRPAPKPPTDKTRRAEAPDQSVQSGQDTLSRPNELRPRPSVRKSLMNKQPSASEVFYSPSDADDGPGRPTVAVRPSSHEHPVPQQQQNRGTFGAPPPPIQSERSPTYSTAERKPSLRASVSPVQGSVEDTGPGTVPVKPPRQPSQRHSVATTPKAPTIVRSPSRRVSMPINFDLLEESNIDDTPSQVSNKPRRPPNLTLGSFQPQTQQEVGPTSPLSRSRPSRSSVKAAPDIMKTLEELDLQDTQLRTAIETFTMRGPGYLNFGKGDVILELEVRK
ncbi:ITSN1 [Branchiostoma lanceolatum]|uniref:ITSN1 protein n=1 Tax=Branchiostoma lanceolatum TaxID=7740 RepID=A0A8K0A1M9_BRALA|nr:ITSN1 [Branchiostoma lanceolatum]